MVILTTIFNVIACIVGSVQYLLPHSPTGAFTKVASLISL